MALPQLSPEQRAAALQKAAEARKARAEVKDKLKHGGLSLAEVLDSAESDAVVGKVRAVQIMEKFKIAESRRVRGLGDKQKSSLLQEFGSSSGGR